MRQEQIIATTLLAAALLFSTVTYSFAHRVIVVREAAPVRVHVVDYGVPGLAEGDGGETGLGPSRIPAYPIGPPSVVPATPIQPGYPVYPPPRKYKHVHDNDVQFPNGGRIRTHDKVVITRAVKATSYGYRYHTPEASYTVYELDH